ncbi:hypothetical protein KC19_1G246700 [Ceratodon purpureus]|uniref:Uncharacterized protein n=1 Tax=Ceratodon purpureus TaxID=3225 RepID=A0A8T0JA38_CERPU|nr:hypothetical protein KC19_1G246700 [Ceratodon purpureus]
MFRHGTALQTQPHGMFRFETDQQRHLDNGGHVPERNRRAEAERKACSGVESGVQTSPGPGFMHLGAGGGCLRALCCCCCCCCCWCCCGVVSDAARDRLRSAFLSRGGVLRGRHRTFFLASAHVTRFLIIAGSRHFRTSFSTFALPPSGFSSRPGVCDALRSVAVAGGLWRNSLQRTQNGSGSLLG